MSDPVIATYREVSFNRKQTVTLYSDRVKIRGKIFFGSEYQVEFLLSQFSSIVNRGRERSKSFWHGIWMVIVGGALGVTALEVPAVPRLVVELSFAVMGTGVMLSVATARKLDHARFAANDGFTLFTVIRSGKDKEHFEQFITLTVEQIKKNSEAQRSQGEK